ncbi:hypothetical protein L3Y34_004026 [Caenorhabditis briggsae]|uniref:Seven TM Receptor n=1 Tax=Caenorhabditis briggsae TaxID=6238 RepID=A0AAE9AAV9_CAEBR|nr:hypothetical protein L3Y34_004026 [Caenorhabditis briggsae]
MNTFSTIAVMSVVVVTKSQSMQSQLFYALVFQTLIPAILLHFPVSVMFGFVLASHGLGIYSCIISITISLYPAIDPLPNFFIISPYRKAAFRCFKRNRQLSEVNQVPPNSKNVVAPANTSAIHYSYRSSVVVLIRTSDKIFNRQTLLFLDAFYWGFFGSSLSIFAIHFVYRYLVISGNPLLRTFQSWKFILWLLIPIVVGFMWAFTGIVLCAPTEEFTEFMRKPIKEVFDEDIEEFEYLGAFMYERSSKNNSFLVYWGPIAGMIIMCLTVFASFIVIVVSGIKCYLRIKQLISNVSTTSSRCQALQSQLFHALVVQTLIPMILLHTPVTLKFAFAIFDAGLGPYCFFMSMTIALYPAIDPLPNFFLISPYRKAIKKILKFYLLGKKPKPNAAEQVNQTSMT